MDLKGRNPDDGATQVPYEKGQALLRLIEVTVGRERFDAYLKGYLARHAFQSITTAMFLDDIRANLIQGDAALEQRLQLDAWIYQPGMPANATMPQSDVLARADDQVHAGQHLDARGRIAEADVAELDAAPQRARRRHGLRGRQHLRLEVQELVEVRQE